MGSTNDVALSLAEQGGAEGLLVGAEMQTSGRGRQGRAWASPPGAGLYVSIILRPAAHVAPLLTLAAGVAAADGIREATGLTVSLKWPNDVFVGTRKLAGILAEAGTSAAAVNFVVLGIGINLMPAAYPPEIASRATSLERELARPVDRGLVLAAWLAALSERYGQLAGGAADRVISQWRAYGADMLGRVVECAVGSRTVIGVAEDIDEDGALLGPWGRSVVPGDIRSGSVAMNVAATPPQCDRPDPCADCCRQRCRGTDVDLPAEYCRQVEAYLCRKNEGHLVRIVGPAFEQVCGWAVRGIPIKVAYRGIDRCVERYHAKGPRRRPVRVEFCGSRRTRRV